jgi:hypothetical protein
MAISFGNTWEAHVMAIEAVSERLDAITAALDRHGIPYAIVGGQAVAIWVATVDPDAVRTTKDVDLLLNRSELPRVRAAARSIEMDYFETMGVGMLLSRTNPNPRSAVHFVWSGELVRPGEPVPAPSLTDHVIIDNRWKVVSLPALVTMKLTAWRDQDRVHLRDLRDVGLVDDELTRELPRELIERWQSL